MPGHVLRSNHCLLLSLLSQSAVVAGVCGCENSTHIWEAKATSPCMLWLQTSVSHKGTELQSCMLFKGLVQTCINGVWHPKTKEKENQNGNFRARTQVSRHETLRHYYVTEKQTDTSISVRAYPLLFSILWSFAVQQENNAHWQLSQNAVASLWCYPKI